MVPHVFHLCYHRLIGSYSVKIMFFKHVKIAPLKELRNYNRELFLRPPQK